MGTHPYGEVFFVSGSNDKQGVTHDKDGGCAEFIIYFVIGFKEFAGYEMPVRHITAPPVAPLIGGKQVIIAFKKRNDRISCSAPASEKLGMGVKP
jgi:hypothetical protein